MISMADLQALFAKVEGTTMAVDLLKVGQSHGSANNGAVSKNKSNHKFRLALDIEDCLDRFYGGYYSDWACGGQWNRAYQFVQLLVNAFDVANIEAIVFFDGSLHDRRRGQLADAKETRQKTISVLKHIRMIGTPPPKIWWLPPSGIRTCIRNALRSLSVQVVQTVNDHTREVIDFYREHKLHGIIGLHPDYIVAQPTHYYSSHDLRLSYKGTLETKEYLVAKLLAHLEVTRAQLPFVAAFLGGAPHGGGVVDKDTVRSVYRAIGVEFATDFESRMKAVAKVVAAAPTNDVAAFVKHLKLDEWSASIREAIEYYQKRERLVKTSNKQQQQQLHAQQQAQQQQQQQPNAKNNKQKRGKVKAGNIGAGNSATSAITTVVEAGKEQLETVVDGCTDNGGNLAAESIIVEVSLAAQLASVSSTALASETSDQDDEFQRKLESDVNNLVEDLDFVPSAFDGELKDMFDGLSLKADEEAKNAATAATNVATPAAPAVSAATNTEPKAATAVKQPSGKAGKGASAERAFVYTLPSDVIKTAYNRHQRGMMDARLYQLLTKKEIVLTQALEDEQYRDVPSVHLFYRPARQMIYAILFNLNHQKYIHSKHPNSSGGNNKSSTAASAVSTNSPQVPKNAATVTAHSAPLIAVNEWLWSPQNEYKRPEIVYATQLAWAVPTIQRLWFGTLFEDKQRRMKAFLSVMRSDAPLMLNRDYVPQHMLAMACVLRYIVTHPERTILSRQELDAFLATAFSPHILNIEYTQELVLPCVYLRGVYLGTLFMQGVETASMANDACGVPLPWTMCNPWLFFDGKLFHLKLKTASYVQSLRELCDDHIEIVLKIERFRKAILEDVEHFLLPTLIGNHHPANTNKSAYFNAGISPMAPNPYFGGGGNVQHPQQQQLTNMDRRRSVQQQLMRQLRHQHRNSDEYHLKVGGVVVGSWAGDLPGRKPFNNNCPAGGQLQRHHHNQLQHQQQQQQQPQPPHPLHQRPNYAPFGDSYQHHHHQRPRGAGLGASIFYNNIAARKRRNQGGVYMNGNCSVAGSGGGGIVHRTIGRNKTGGPLAAGVGHGAEAKLAKNKARKQRSKNSKVAAAAATTATTSTATVVAASATVATVAGAEDTAESAAVQKPTEAATETTSESTVKVVVAETAAAI